MVAQQEIDEGAGYIGYRDALTLILTNTGKRKIRQLPLQSAVGYVTAADVVAQVDSPTNDVSLKDGFAVKASDVADAGPGHAVKLRLVGSVFAGGEYEAVAELKVE